MSKINFTSASVKDFKKFINTEHKSLSNCLRTIRDNWTGSELQAVAKRDGLRKDDLNPAYMVKWLDGSNYCQNGVLGRMAPVEKGSKDKEFRAWETWTPGRALDYLRRASANHWKSLNAEK